MNLVRRVTKTSSVGEYFEVSSGGEFFEKIYVYGSIHPITKEEFFEKLEVLQPLYQSLKNIKQTIDEEYERINIAEKMEVYVQHEQYKVYAHGKHECIHEIGVWLFGTEIDTTFEVKRHPAIFNLYAFLNNADYERFRKMIEMQSQYDYILK